MVEIDFTPLWYREQLTEAKGKGFRIVGLLIIAALVLVWSWDSTARTQAAMRAVSALENTLRVQEGMMVQLDALASERVERDRNARLLANVGGGVQVAEVITELSHLMPPSMMLRSLRLSKAPRIKEKTALVSGALPVQNDAQKEEPQTTLEILGWAPSGAGVGVFVKQLAESPLFSQVDLRYERSDTVGARRFVEFLIAAVMPEFE